MSEGNQEQSLHDTSLVPPPVKGWLLQLSRKQPPDKCSVEECVALNMIRNNLFSCAKESLETLMAVGKLNVGQSIAFVAQLSDAYDKAVNALLLDKSSAPFSGPPPALRNMDSGPPAAGRTVDVHPGPAVGH
jgi:hypothetical protein